MAPAAPKPRRSPRTRVLALGLGAALCCLVASGCSSFDKAAYKMHVRAACNGLPDVSAEAIATGVPLSSAIDVVVYNTTGASLVDITRLEECLNKFSPQVEGIDSQDSSDDS